MPTSSAPPLDAIRARFPGLAQDTVFLENAGGSQVTAAVADAVHDYMRRTYVQLGADYALSQHCSDVVARAHDDVRTLMGGDGSGDVILGPSSSQLLRMLADAYAATIRPGDEIVVAECGHEANVGPWLGLAERGATIRWWPVDQDTGSSPLALLDAVLGERTRIVAFPHVSNLLGEVLDVAEITRRAHAVGARVVVDGVAYAPHRAMDVAGWQTDWYAYSAYKVYGPHMGALYGSHAALAELEGPNHFFIGRDEVPYKFELGGCAHEGCAGLLALREHLQFLAGRATYDRTTVEAAFEVVQALERPLQARLVDWLSRRDAVRLIGPARAGPARVATISFVHRTRSSRELALAANAAGIGIRHGHMYAHRLCTALGLEPEDGVVRISAVHYNTLPEIERLIEVLDPLLRAEAP